MTQSDTVMNLPGTLWLASDLHLQESTPTTREAFLAWLEGAAQSADHLLLPGDIFDAWVGDDVLDVAPAWLREVVAGLAAAGQRTDLWLGHGNRDFLMGERLAQATGARLLPAEAVLHTVAGRVLLMHGDELCTDDHAYQQMRQVVRNPAWQADMLRRSLPERLQLAQQLRDQSEAGKAGKDMAIMDVNAQAVVRFMQAHGVTRMIHGHTHRPGRHVFELDGAVAERWVLPDWDFEHQPVRGGWLSLDADGLALHDLDASA